MKKQKSAPSVFAVPDYETASGKKHEVIFAEDGDLNRGQREEFQNWQDAVAFARKKGREMGAEVVIHGYFKTPPMIIKYHPVKQETPEVLRLASFCHGKQKIPNPPTPKVRIGRVRRKAMPPLHAYKIGPVYHIRHSGVSRRRPKGRII